MKRRNRAEADQRSAKAEPEADNPIDLDAADARRASESPSPAEEGEEASDVEETAPAASPRHDGPAWGLWCRAGVPPAHRQFIEGGHALIRDDAWLRTLRFLSVRCGVPTRVGSTFGLIGPNGTGKTQLAAYVIWSCTMLHRRCRYVKAPTMIGEMHDAGRSGASQTRLLARHLTPDVLVIDEIDKRIASEWEHLLFHQLVDRRYESGKHTIMMGNYTRAGFDDEMDQAVVSRIEEAGAVIEADWRNFRQNEAT